VVDYFDNWVVQARKGFIESCVLNALTARERYGYDLVKALVEMPGLGVTEGTIYPLLSRLRMQGLVETRLVESSEGPARKYYTLTKKGQRVSKLMNKHMDMLLEGSQALRKEGENNG